MNTQIYQLTQENLVQYTKIYELAQENLDNYNASIHPVFT